MADQIATVDKKRLTKKIRAANAEEMKATENGIKIQLDLNYVPFLFVEKS